MAALSLGVPTLPAGLEDLLQRTDGLPLFVEEVLAAAADAGALRRVGDRWEFRRWIGPRSGHDAGTIARRLGALSATERSVIGAAALLGRRFDVELVGPIVAVESDVAMAALRRCTDQQLLVWKRVMCGSGMRSLVTPSWTRCSGRNNVVARSALTVITTVHPGLPDGWCELAARLHEAAGEPSGCGGVAADRGPP